MDNSIKPHPKPLFIIGICAFCAFAIVAIILAIINSGKTATLEILVAPSFAQVELDGHSFSTNQTIKYYPGDYQVTVSAPDFTSQTLELNLVANQSSHLLLYLTPADGSLDFYSRNPKEDNLLQEILSQIALTESSEFLARYPVARILPYDHYTQNEFFEPTGYRIDYGHFDNCKNSFCLQVTGYTQSALSEAKSYLQSKGFNPNDYEIVFNYTPLDKPSPEDFPPEIRKALEAAGYFD